MATKTAGGLGTSLVDERSHLFARCVVQTKPLVDTRAVVIKKGGDFEVLGGGLCAPGGHDRDYEFLPLA